MFFFVVDRLVWVPRGQSRVCSDLTILEGRAELAEDAFSGGSLTFQYAATLARFALSLSVGSGVHVFLVDCDTIGALQAVIMVLQVVAIETIMSEIDIFVSSPLVMGCWCVP